jgi:hypothetical protein
MTSFTNSTTRALVAGALILGAGVYFQNFASIRLDEAQQAVRQVSAAQSQAETTKRRAEQYVSLLAKMADSRIDRQEPFSVVSEFSAQEISEVGPLLDTLYQRDGHFFLKRFQLAWRDGDEKLGLLPRVALDLEGRKVLMFSDAAGIPSSVVTAER